MNPYLTLGIAAVATWFGLTSRKLRVVLLTALFFAALLA